MGFNWQHGPFELIDRIGPERLAETLAASGGGLPKMLDLLIKRGASAFYRSGGREQLGPDGAWHPVP